MFDCGLPIWRLDDFTTCFQRDFLQTLLPLVAVGVSLALILIQLSQWTLNSSRSQDYSSLDGSDDANGFPKDISAGSDGTTVFEDQQEHLSTQTTLSGSVESVVEISRPKGLLFLTVAEILALLGQVGINAAAVATHAWGRHGQVAAISSLSVWAYIFILASLRLSLPRLQRNPLPTLWNHTASLYCIQWLFIVILFRSEILHPRSQRAHAFMIADFVLASLLAITAITMRQGGVSIVLKHEGNIEPSREPLASVLSNLTFSWVDAIVLKGYRKTFELSDVWNLLPRDKAAKILADYRQIKKTTRLTFRLLRFFRREIIIQAVWAAMSGLFTFMPTLLLKSILEYVESPDDTPTANAWLYVILLAVSGIITAVTDGQALWIGRKICIRLRAILVGEIYAKTLRRKAATAEHTDLSAKEKKPTGIVDLSAPAKKKKGLKAKIGSLFGKKKSNETPKPASENETPEGTDSATQVNAGTIINLMSTDSFKVAEISAYMHFLFPTVPIELAVAITLLYKIMGWSSIAGIGVMICLMPINIYFAGQFTRAAEKIMASTDARIQTTNEVLQNIRIIKYFAWEQRFAQNVNEKRRVEIRALRYRLIVWASASCVWYAVPMIITGVSFFLYTVVEKKPLIPSVAFTALSLFSLLRYPLDRLADMTARVLESKVSVDRVEKFLNEEETGKYDQLAPQFESAGEESFIGFRNATFSWGAINEKPDQVNKAFRLINMDIKFHTGSLNIVAGKTGSGKSSLLMALLGEMTLIHGRVHLPGAGGRENLKVDPETGLTEGVAYCAQQAWLVNDTIKQNIIFASPWDESRYNSVIQACALTRDLEILDAGDATLVGEKGIVVSGGQKQRISLARALYCNARHLLLDDCLSAVDSHTAQHIFEQCVMGPLMLNRTCILVTHNVSLCVPQSQFVVVLANGKIAAQGPPDKVMESGVLGDEISKSKQTSKTGTAVQSRTASTDDLTGKASTKPNDILDQDSKHKGKATEDVEDANLRTEDKAEGAVDWRVFRVYLRAMGPWYFWFCVPIAFVAENIASVSTNVWIRQWANSYQTDSVSLLSTQNTSTITGYVQPAGNAYRAAFTWGIPLSWTFPFLGISPGQNFAVTDTHSVNVSYYLVVYGILGVCYILVCLFRLGLLFKGSLNASRALHEALLDAVLRAKFKFFDTTPLGQIMNRFSKDLQAIDQEVAWIAGAVIQGLFGMISIIILISVITPGFLIAGLFLSGVYFCIGMFYVRSSRDLKRLESVQRSPLYQQFGETLSGVTTIRAYGDERRFIEDNLGRVNTHNRPFIYLWSANRWLALRVDFAGAFVAFFAGAFVVASARSLDAGAAGLSLTYALTFNENVLWLVRLYADNEQNMNHVERVKVFLDLEQEAPALVPEHQPPGNWPSKGAVEFVDYTTRYRPELDPVLKKISIKIQPEEKVGIVGRTGAGKSSLALALFRGLEAEEGKILIDNVDIGQIGLQNLRENITIVPQDPTLFTGTIRTNVDPFGLFTDEEIFTALRRVHLIGASALDGSQSSKVVGQNTDGNGTLMLAVPESILEAPSEDTDEALQLTKTQTNTRENTNVFLNLLSPISESGSNLSQGQRQLLCLARALLKNPRVLLMDEATASIDYATDAKIQDTLREIQGSTIITIAHRLQTIIDYDKVLVLDKGEVVEFAPPWELIAKDGGFFQAMCEMSGDMEGLKEAARKAERKGLLVDV